jgi:hypothetical protein
LSFFKKYGGDLANIASSSLSTANTQVKKNVVAMLGESFAKRQLEN